LYLWIQLIIYLLVAEKNSKCDHCGYVFAAGAESAFESHLKLHAEREAENQKFACILANCDKVLRNSNDFKKHVLSEHEVLGMLRCEFCHTVTSGTVQVPCVLRMTKSLML